MPHQKSCPQQVNWCPTPIFKPQKYTWAQKRGLQYERKVKKLLKKHFAEHEILDGPWINYDGKICQPDIVIIPKVGLVVVVEIKNTFKSEGIEKLDKLYVPLVTHILKRKVIGVQIFRRQAAEQVLAEGIDTIFNKHLGLIQIL